ncbi:hypothetical protein E2562_014607 [Oryza meyeriana var. granulata]|uniref:Uncharacterized protein n=1 Tax=Oryza meyeriana var. granulata TaxID=110450 RepID=A0A6G1DWM4_9ORYZ|nr:hypothetical protein E2562_014607 [Oryza meyeriana var. granulata]
MAKMLDVINFVNNKFDGFVPMEIGCLQNTIIIDVSGNVLVRTSPKTLCNCTKLEQLDVSRNVFTGIVHETISKLPVFVSFSFSFNFFNSESTPCMTSENANVTLDDRATASARCARSRKRRYKACPCSCAPSTAASTSPPATRRRENHWCQRSIELM